MAKYLAIEWDESELRIAVGKTRGSGIAVDETHAVPLADGATPAAIGEAIKAAVGAGTKGVETLIAIPRASVEIRQLQLPSAPSDEMPEMVRFQAMRQFSAIGDDWPLDFVELERTDENVQVLASVISPDTFRDIQQVCESSEIVAQHLCLRPFASAELLKTHLGNDTTCRLITDVMSVSADLGVVVDGQIAFMRTVRIPPVPDGAELPVQGLMGEIRRTIAAASNQLSGQQVKAVTLFGIGTRLEPLRKAIETQLKLDAEIWNPFTNVRLNADPPSRPGRWAALLGMMLNQATDTRQPIDFLNPRRRPKPQSSREKYLLYSFLSVVAVAILAVGAFLMVDQKNRQIAELQRQKTTSDLSVVKATVLQGQADLVATFQNESVNFIEEISNISAVMPDPKDARVSKLTGALNHGEAQMTMDVQVKNHLHISEIESSLQDKDRQVNGRRSRERGEVEFPWSFQTITVIDPIERRRIAAEVAKALSAVSDKNDVSDATDADATDADATDADATDADATDADATDADATDADATDADATDADATDADATDADATDADATDADATDADATDADATDADATDADATDADATDADATDADATDADATDADATDADATDADATDADATDADATDADATDADATDADATDADATDADATDADATDADATDADATDADATDADATDADATDADATDADATDADATDADATDAA